MGLRMDFLVNHHLHKKYGSNENPVICPIKNVHILLMHLSVCKSSHKHIICMDYFTFICGLCLSLNSLCISITLIKEILNIKHKSINEDNETSHSVKKKCHWVKGGRAVMVIELGSVCTTSFNAVQCFIRTNTK